MKKIVIILLMLAIAVSLVVLKSVYDKSKEKPVETEIIETTENIEESNTDPDVQSTELDNDFEPLEVVEEYNIEIEEGLEGALSD